ncbi:MAG: sigma 54-interacting transcriptional regulator [Candidatus Acidiferrales bacterium]
MTNNDLDTRGPSANSIPEHLVFGRSIEMQELRQVIQNVAGASVPILIVGDPGTGKEVIGREIHRRSPWSSAPFVKVTGSRTNLGRRHHGMSDEKSETSAPFWEPVSRAAQDHPARMLFIDEVGELSPPLQAKLLEFFQDDLSNRPNHEPAFSARARVICSTRRNLEREVAAGRFRLDLLYRINVVTIKVPRLRDRREDIPDLTEYFFQTSCRYRDHACPRFPSSLVQRLCEHDWPGNIRELEDCVRTYVNGNGNVGSAETILSKGTPARTEIKGPLKGSMPLKTYTKQLVEQAERDLILKVLREQRWNRRETARVLQVSYQTLLHKLKQTGLIEKRKTSRAMEESTTPAERLP